jgi:hypothetical protein
MIHLLAAFAIVGFSYGILARGLASGRMYSPGALFRRGMLFGYIAGFVVAIAFTSALYALLIAIPMAFLLGALFRIAPGGQSVLINRLPTVARDRALETRKRAMERQRRRSGYFGP